MPVIILGGIRFGIFTPTEAAVIAAVYALFVGMFIYRELKLTPISISCSCARPRPPRSCCSWWRRRW
jgi:TRAP-type C4-dicarboxylate transport system permease large subunit